MKTVKLLIVGLDAATLDLINPWVAEGKLPNIARLINAGASGRVAPQSCHRLLRRHGPLS